MNVKISETAITFKINEQELGILMSGTALERKTVIGGSEFVMRIDPRPHKFFDELQEKPLKLILDRAESCLMLCTTMAEIKKLNDMGRNRDGLSTQVDGVDVFLQVDIRKDHRSKKEAFHGL